MIREEFAKINPSFSLRELKLIYFDKGGNIYRGKEEFLEQKAGQLRLL